MESISNKNISIFYDIIYETYNESDDQAESRAGNEFEFVMLSLNQKYPQIFGH